MYAKFTFPLLTSTQSWPTWICLDDDDTDPRDAHDWLTTVWGGWYTAYWLTTGAWLITGAWWTTYCTTGVVSHKISTWQLLRYELTLILFDSRIFYGTWPLVLIKLKAWLIVVLDLNSMRRVSGREPWGAMALTKLATKACSLTSASST